MKAKCKIFLYGLMICLFLCPLTGCNGGGERQEEKPGGTGGVSRFVPYTQSITTGHNEFEQECSGDMYLLVSMKEKGKQQKYELGKCAVVDNSRTDYSDITQM